MSMIRNFRCRARLHPGRSAGLLLLLTLGTWGLWALSLHRAQTEVEAQQNAILQDKLVKARQLLEAQVQSGRQQLELIAMTPAIAGFRSSDEQKPAATPGTPAPQLLWKEHLERLFVALLQTSNTSIRLRVISTLAPDSGQELIRVSRSGNSIEVMPAATLQNQTFKPYVQTGLSLQPEQIHVSPGALSPAEQALMEPQSILRLLRPIFSRTRHLAALLIAEVSLQSSLNQLREPADSGYRFYLTNASGDFLLHPDPNRELAVAGEGFFRWQNAFGTPLDTRITGNTLMAASNPQGERIRYRQAVLSLGTPQRSSDLFLVAALEDSRLDEYVTTCHRQFLLAIGAALLLLSGSALTGRILRQQRQSRQRKLRSLAAIIDSCPHVIIAIDVRGRIAVWNMAAETCFHQPSSEVLDKPFQHWTRRHPHVDFGESRVRQALQEGQPSRYSIRFPDQGRICTLDVQLSVIRSGGQTRQIVLIMQEISTPIARPQPLQIDGLADSGSPATEQAGEPHRQTAD